MKKLHRPRWRVITYDDRDGGADEKLDYKNLRDAKLAAEEYTNDHEGAIVYDALKGKIKFIYGYFSDNALPTESA